MKIFDFFKNKQCKENDFIPVTVRRRNEIEDLKRWLGDKYLCSQNNFIKRVR